MALFVRYGKKKPAKARRAPVEALKDVPPGITDGSRRLAGLQRSAFNPELADAAVAVFPELRERMLATFGIDRQSFARVAKDLDDSLPNFLTALELPASAHVRNSDLEALHDLVADGARGLGVAPLEEVTVGALHAKAIDAFSNSFFGAGNIIGVNIPLMVFAYLIAKATAAFPFAASPFAPDAGQPVVPEPLYRLGLRWLTQLVQSVAVEGEPIGVDAYSPPNVSSYWRAVSAWTNGIELFIVAHEYAHLVHARDSAERLRELGLLGSNECLEDSVDSEIAADRFALAALWKVMPSKHDGELTAFGPLVFLWFLARLEQDLGCVLHGANHPSSPARLASAENLFPSDGLARAWTVVRDRLDTAWSYAGRAALELPTRAAFEAEIASRTEGQVEVS